MIWRVTSARSNSRRDSDCDATVDIKTDDPIEPFDCTATPGIEPISGGDNTVVDLFVGCTFSLLLRAMTALASRLQFDESIRCAGKVSNLSQNSKIRRQSMKQEQVFAQLAKNTHLLA